MSPHQGEKKTVDVLPANFTFSSDHSVYYGPPTCELLHYRTAAYVAALIETLVMIAGAVVCWEFYYTNQSLDKWVLLSMFGLLGFSILTSVVLFYGLFSEMPNLIRPKIAFIQMLIFILMMLAFVSITAMSVGIEMTNALFGIFVRVVEMERDFGPLWPFNIGVVAFFTACISIWKHAIYQSALDYLLDKEYFSNAPSIELAKSLPKEE